MKTNTLTKLLGAFGICDHAPGLRAPEDQDPAGLDQIRNVVLAVGLRNLLVRKSFFSICDFRALCDAANVTPDGDLLRLLEVLHCVQWSDIPEPTRSQVKSKIVEVFAAVVP